MPNSPPSSSYSLSATAAGLAAAAAAANIRPVPYIKIIHQPSQVYRMRYKAEKRTTFLYAENFTDKGGKTGDSLSSASSSTSSALALGAGSGAKKAAPVRKKAVVGPGASDHPDGMFPKIEVNTGRSLLKRRLTNQLTTAGRCF